MYSLLESPFRPEDIARKAKAEGMKAAALTDLNTMAGTAAFDAACRKEGIKPLFGMETEAEGLRFLLLAKNEKGLQSLYKISSLLQEDKIMPASLQSMAGDCFVILLGIDDALQQAMMQEDQAHLHAILAKVRQNGPVYLAQSMMDSGLRREKFKLAKKLAQELDIPAVAVSYTLYENQEDSRTLRALKSIQQNTTLQAVQAGYFWDRQFYPAEEMNILYDADALAMADWIAEQTDVDLDRIPKSGLPLYANRAGIPSGQWLERLAKKGLEKRLNGHVPEPYRNRLAKELAVIHSMGFDDYFLIIYDMVLFASGKGILTGPGRGSAAGSLTAWCLGITHVDPVANGLLFERFLNPARITMPDIDLDFPDDRRDEILQYMQEKYGSGHAVQIAAFSNLKARQALRDAGKALGFHEAVVSPLASLVPNLPGMTLQKAWDTIPLFQKRIRQKKDLMDIYGLARQLEGLPRHMSIHAAGMVLSRLPVQDVVPLAMLDGVCITQFPAEYLERFGLIKMDILSLRNLTIISRILEQIKKSEGAVIDPYKTGTDDKATYDLLSRGDTLGVFQLEKEGIRQLLRKIRPSSFADVAIVLALYRPGPMQEIDRYLQNRKNPDRIRYVHPVLEPILKETYGVMIYQEQIMETAVRAGGFTLSEADLLRKAMSKKQKDVMDRFEQQFVAGAKEKGIPEEAAREIFALMDKFAGYGFNKSHSYAYGRISWLMAWLKAHYPLLFYQQILNGVMGSQAKTGQYLYECRQRRVQILPMDLRYSGNEWQLEQDGIRMPLSIIKGIGKNVLDKLEAVTADDPDVVETVSRMWAWKIPEAQIRALVSAGALDYTGANRMTILYNLEHILNYSHIVRVQGQDRLFDFDIASKPTLVPMAQSKMDTSRLEKEAFGFYVSEHPVSVLRKEYPYARPIASLEDVTGRVEVVGRVAGFHSHRTKKGDLMAFVDLEDETGQTSLAVMPDLLQKKRADLTDGTLLRIRGKKDRPGSILVQQMERLDVK